MDFIKKYINVFFVVMAMFFSNIAFSATNASIPVSDCGIENNVVKFLDGEICEQDISFGILYKMFPTVIEEFVFPIIKPAYLHLVPQLEQQNLFIYQTQELIFFEIFKSVTNISYLIIAIFVAWHFIFLGLLRSASDGSFLGNSWKTSSVIIKYGLLTTLMLPLSSSGLLVIHILILSMVIMGIYFANFFWGVYLNYLQIGEDSVNLESINDNYTDQQSSRVEQFESNISKFDHNYFFAYSYAKELTKVALCKQRTEKLLYQSTLPFVNPTNIGDLNKCLLNDSSSSWDKDIVSQNNYKSFIHYKNNKTNVKSSNASTFSVSSITFENKDFLTCQAADNVDFSSVDFNCGSISVSPISIPEGGVEIAIRDSNFNDIYLSTSKSAMDSADPYETVSKGWSSIETSIGTLFEKGASLDNYKHNKSNILKNTSYIYHKMMMNDVLIGNSSYTKNGNSNDYKQSDNFNLILSEYLKDAERIATEIQKLSCVENAHSYELANNASTLINGYINNTVDKVQSYNTSCLDLNTLQPITFDPVEFIKSDSTGAVYEAKKEQEKKLIKESGYNLLKELITKIYNKRNAIEKSFYKSMITSNSNDMVNNLRKKGWAISGGYMLKLLSEKEIDNKLEHALKNGVVLKTEILNNKGFPNFDITKLMNEKNTETLKDWSDINSGLESIVESNNIKPSRKDLKYVDANQYINDNILENMNAGGGNDNLEVDELFGLFNISNQLKSVVGISETGELSLDEISNCIKGNVSTCPINLTNPILDLSKLGHNLINISLSIITVGIGIVVAEYYASKSIEKFNKGGIGSVSSGSEDEIKASGDENAKKTLENKKTAENKSKIDNGNSKIKWLSNVLSVLSFLIGMFLTLAFFLLTIGLTLAYVIPLIPFVSFTIALISWAVISLEILIIAPIWLGFLFRLEDTNNTNSELYRAGFNFAMQILFRPALIMISLIIGWSLFNIIFVIINLSMATFITVFLDKGWFFDFIYGILILIAYSLVIYVAIKQVFNLIIKLPNDVFKKIGVTPLDSSYESKANDTISKLTMGGVALSGIVGESTKTAMKNSKSIRDNSRNEIKKQKSEQLEEQRKKEKEKARGGNNAQPKSNGDDK